MRPSVYAVGLEQHISNLMLSKGISKEEATEFVKKVMRERNKPPELNVLHYPRPGYEENIKIPFNRLLTDIKDNILTPSGRVYWDPAVNPSMMSQYTENLLAMRKYHKDRMFAFQQAGKQEEAAIEKGAESKIKIDTNTITAGAKNSPYSAFFDKAGFNAITAVARLMIKTNYVLLENNLGGNFHWENKDELRNWIILHIRNAPSQEIIEGLVSKYNLYVPTHKDVMDRFQFFMNLYEVGPSYLHRKEYYDYEPILSNSNADHYINSTCFEELYWKAPIRKKKEDIVDLSRVRDLVNKLPQHLVTFLFYVNNLRLLIWMNEKTFRPIFDSLIKGHEGELIPRAYEDIFKLDKDYEPIITTRYAELVKGKDIPKIKDTEPETIQILSNYANHIHPKITDLEDIISVFCKPKVASTRTGTKEKMWRNTTLGSDTDSVLYTLAEWMFWFNGDIFSSTTEGVTFTAILGYLVTKVAKHQMYIYSSHLGAKGKDRYHLEMKGEYDFVSMTFYPIKKHYTGVMDKQEGRVLPKLKLDIKGIGLRNSSIPKSVAGMMQQFVIDTQQRQKAAHFLKRVLEMESVMARSLRGGEKEFLKTISVNDEESYDDPERTAFFYLNFWNEVFGEKYGLVHPPVKPPSVFLLPMSLERLDLIKEIDPKIHRKLLEFKGRYPNRKNLISIIINPLLHKVPEEIVILTDMRKHIHTNMRPLYLSLESYGIPMMHNDKFKLVLSDYYSEFDLRLLETEEGE